MVKEVDLIGVLDMDCRVTKGYYEIDQAFLEKDVDILLSNFNINTFSFINN
ncbi:GAF domain-containing protein, partial [Enterococcus faecium]|nr:GAF domain-containing protein [Enterococcus faecium]